jgi:branched-chain amino acid transport system permease protein
VVLTLPPEALRHTGDWQRNLFGQIYIDPADCHAAVRRPWLR